MAWRENLRPASFRGVRFNVDGSSLGIGRRLARHEYPQRDIPYLEDMGRKAREYKVEAIVLGEDYMSERDALIDALETAGAGQLVHPYHGTVAVKVSGDVQINETTREGGIARFSILFIESGKEAEPGNSSDTETVLDDQYAATDMAFAEDFADDFSIEGAPDFVVQDALDQIDSVLTLPDIDLGNLAWLRADPLSTLKSLLPENLLASLAMPMSLATGLMALVRGAQRYGPLFGFADSLKTTSNTSVSSSRLMQEANRSALGNFMLQVATSRRVVDLAKTSPATVEDARTLRAEIVKRTDDVLFSEGIRQRSADAMVQLRTDALRHLAGNAADLPRLVLLKNQADLPAIVVAHDFYGDEWSSMGRAEDLVTRNKIRHPGFVPAGQSLKLISN